MCEAQRLIVSYADQQKFIILQFISVVIFIVMQVSRISLSYTGQQDFTVMQVNSSAVIQVISILFSLLVKSTVFHGVIQVNRISLLVLCRSTVFHCCIGQQHFTVMQVNSISL